MAASTIAPGVAPAQRPDAGYPITTGLQKQRQSPVICHEVDYEILGYEAQIVEVELDPGETVVAEAGAMNYMENGIHYESKMGDGSNPKSGFLDGLLSVGRRLLTGESIMMTHFTNNASAKKRVAFAAPYPGSIIPLDMNELGNKILCQKDAFLAAALGTEISIAFNRRIGAGFFGGEGFILQSLKGDGLAFIHAGGTVIRKDLNNEKLLVDTGCLVAFTSGIDYDIQMVRGLKSMFFGGEGLFFATLTGTGTVWLQSAPFSRLADRVLQHAPSAGGRSQGEGSILGGVGRLLDGD
ncbi:MAG: TIGR00266 family protein [Pseudomonadales bacterium]|nr:TIGR00266 family protein [Pseudomonadales bacterium]